MTVITYYANINQGVGKLYYPSLSGEVEIQMAEDIYNDLIEASSQLPDPITAPAGSALTSRLVPMIKVTSGLESLGFISTPEARFKIGTYSAIPGYTVSVNSEGLISTTPVAGVPFYIVYPSQVLQSFVCGSFHPIVDGAVNPFNPFDYEIVFGDYAGIFRSDEYVYDIRGYSTSANSSNQAANGLYVNLTPGIVADLVVYYYYVIGSNFFGGSNFGLFPL